MDESCGRKIWIYCQNFHTFYECVSIFYAWLPYQIIWFTAAATNLPNQLPHGAPIHDPNKPHTDWIDWDPIKYRNLMWPDLGSAHIQCMHVYTTAEHRQKHAHTHTFKHTHLVTQTHTHSCSIMQESPHTHTHSRTVPLRVSALWEICLLEEDITSRHQPALPSPARQTELPWLRQWKIKTTLTGVQSIMEIQKPSSSCEWVMRRREVGGGRRGVVIFADGIIARQRGEANRQMDSGSKDSSFFFLNFS